jgi:hypothetical protein
MVTLPIDITFIKLNDNDVCFKHLCSVDSNFLKLVEIIVINRFCYHRI